MKLFDMIGGIGMIEKIVDNMYARVQQDPILAPVFKDKDVGKIVKHQYIYLTSIFGGPTPWSGRGIKEIHDGIGIDKTMMDRYVELFRAAAIDSGMTSKQAAKFTDAISGFRHALVPQKDSL
jgi:hemoglobin